jgi:hypothetical protein
MSWRAFGRPAIRASLGLAAALFAGARIGAASDRRQAQAQLLDRAEFLCANCFFGPSSYYYCFEADHTILVGRERAPVLNWRDSSKNYLTKVHGGWAAWSAPGQTVPISYDDKHIWVSRPEGKPAKRNLWGDLKALAAWVSRANRKQVKLTRSSPSDIFTHDGQCRSSAGPAPR